MTSPSGPRANGHAPDSVAAPRRPSPRPGPAPDREPPTEQVPVVDVPPGSPTQAVPVIDPLFGSYAAAPPRHRPAEPPTEVVPVVAPRPVQEPLTEAVPVVRQEPPTAAVKVIPPDLFTQHLPPAAAPPAAAPAATAEGEGAKEKRRLPVDLSPRALRRSWTASNPPRPVRRAFLAALLGPAVHVVTVVLVLAFIAVSYGTYSVGTVLGDNLLAVAAWVVAALVALWVGVQARAGRLWAAIALAVLAVVGLVVTVELVLAALTWIGLSGLPGVVRLVLLVLAALLCLAVPLLLIDPLRKGYFRQAAAVV